MKKPAFYLLSLFLPGIFSIFAFSQIAQENHKFTKFEKAIYNSELEFLKTRDLFTNSIPDGIKARELEFSSKIPSKESAVFFNKQGDKILKSQDWVPRGPTNISGRIKAISFDIRNENIIIAGSASGGLWRTLDGGLSWVKVIPNDFSRNVYCVTQDRRKGKENIWYYGTGELLSTTNRKYNILPRTVGAGDGIFKSTDNGASWFQLQSTRTNSPTKLSNFFQGVWNIVVDENNTKEDVLYAACYGAVLRSSDGGNTWKIAIGDSVNKSFSTSVAITNEGTLYAGLSSYTTTGTEPQKTGIWRSFDGTVWENITAPNFPDYTRVIKISLAPSNNNVFYVLTEYPIDPSNVFESYHNLWKGTYNSKTGQVNWENRSQNLPVSTKGELTYSTLGGYCCTINVKPDDENFVVIGGTNLIFSLNGFLDQANTRFIGGYANWYCHPDIHSITFPPSDPGTVFIGCDGGVVRSNNYTDMANIRWITLNNGLMTTQFYDIAIDYFDTDDMIIGGLQDNFSAITTTASKTDQWVSIGGGDGMGCAIPKDKEFLIISSQYGRISTGNYSKATQTMGNTLLQTPTFIQTSSSPMFCTQFILDPINNKTLYLPFGNLLWRKTDIAAATKNYYLIDSGWTEITMSSLSDGNYISALAISTNTADIVLIGTVYGNVYRIDNSSGKNPTLMEITPSDFPKGFISSIDIDPHDADKILVTFSNYNIISIFYSSDGGANWENAGGNLEENADGSGSGPSVRCIKTAHFAGKTLYFAGTSTGLYSTNEIKGNQTEWVQEGKNSFGNILIDNIETRETDGLVALATQGSGVYTTKLNFTGVETINLSNNSLYLEQNNPNPAVNRTSITFFIPVKSSVKLSLFDVLGVEIDIILNKDFDFGKYSIELNTDNLINGTYFYRLETDNGVITRKMVVVK